MKNTPLKFKEDFLENIKLYEKEKNVLELALIQEQFGDFLLNQLGENNDAIEYYSRSSKTYRQIGELEKGVLVSCKSARLQSALGQFTRALEAYNKLLGLVNQRNLIKYKAVLNAEIGNIYRITGNVIRAKDHLFRAIDYMNDLQISDSDKEFIRLAYAKYLLSQLLLEDGRIQLEKLGAVSSGSFLVTKARLFILQKELEQAEDALQDVLKLVDKPEDQEVVGLAYLNLGLLKLSRNEFSEALSMVNSALSFFEMSSSWRVNEGYHLAARCHLGLGEITDAEALSERATRGYVNLSLYSRINYVEQTLHSIDNSIVDEMGEDELIYEFSNLGL